jgi:hypothetical protein
MTTPTPEPPIPAVNLEATPTPTVATTTSSTPAPAPSVAPDISGGALTAAVLSGAVVAAVVSGWVNAALARRSTQLEERSRVRSTLAEAYQAYADYKEFPYAIRRRRADQLAEERIRLSEEIRRVQSRLSYYQAWTQAESPETGAAYNELVTQLRRIAGASMRAGWQEPALNDDAGMNIGPDRVDLAELREAEKRFLRAAETHVTALTTPLWLRALKRLRSGRGSTAP